MKKATGPLILIIMIIAAVWYALSIDPYENYEPTKQDSLTQLKPKKWK